MRGQESGRQIVQIVGRAADVLEVVGGRVVGAVVDAVAAAVVVVDVEARVAGMAGRNTSGLSVGVGPRRESRPFLRLGNFTPDRSLADPFQSYTSP